MKKKSRNSIYIGNKDIYEWTMGEGKDYLFPLIFDGAKELIKNYTKEKLHEIHCARVEVEIRKNKKAFDFWVTKEELSDTLNKLMDWALEKEEYEKCSKIKKLLLQVEEIENTF